MIKTLLKFFLNSIPNPRSSLDLAKLKMSFLYIKSIKTFRFLFLSLFGIGICLVFLLSSLILFHTSLFLYTPWSNEIKMGIGILCTIIYFSIALSIFSKIFSQKRWMEIFHAESLLGDLAQKVADQQESKKPEYESAEV
jgi:hypothetical protein